MRGWVGGLGLLGGCIFGGGRVDAEDWPKKAARATCDFTRQCAEAAFYRDYTSVDNCRTTNELALTEEASDAIDDECPFDEIMAEACLDALGSTCRDAGQNSETVFEPCTMVWNCDGEPSPTTDSGY